MAAAAAALIFSTWKHCSEVHPVNAPQSLNRLKDRQEAAGQTVLTSKPENMKGSTAEISRIYQDVSVHHLTLPVFNVSSQFSVFIFIHAFILRKSKAEVLQTQYNQQYLVIQSGYKKNIKDDTKLHHF